MCFQHSKRIQLIHEYSKEIVKFLLKNFVEWEYYFVFVPKNSKINFFFGRIYDVLVSILNLETRCSNSVAGDIALAVLSCLRRGETHPESFVIIDPTYSRTTIDPRPSQNTFHFTNGNKASLSVT